ncbi:suppressor of fused domain protein [uncultured Chitinophaga sp.]|uniref:suppressor of fused domain protein n=1 Tax=uncultured Chitinophaga sp. TaxID=339340 RepID=UPI0025F536AD|nr:suppressor of fused domain protein [uncultured Chitinophaga sp.]
MEKVSASELYLRHLEQIFQREPEFYTMESPVEGLPGVTALVYKDIPEPGYITGFTYGLSLVEHPDWQLGRPELCISVKSENMAWATVAAYMANHLRGDCPFLYAQTINFGDQIAADSPMDAFFVFAPSLLEREDYVNIDIGLGYKINIAGLYPMYAAEIPVLEAMGLEKFWHHPHFDLYDVNREMITGE